MTLVSRAESALGLGRVKTPKYGAVACCDCGKIVYAPLPNGLFRKILRQRLISSLRRSVQS